MPHKFNEDLAKDAALLIPGLSAEERRAVVSILQDVSEELSEPDMTILEARKRARIIKASITKARALTEQMYNGWGNSYFMLPKEIVKYSMHVQALKKMESDAEAMLDKLLAMRQKHGKGGLLTQQRRALPKNVAIAAIACIWYDATLLAPRDETSRQFLELAWEAVSGETNGPGFTHILPPLLAKIPKETTPEVAERAVAAIDLVNKRSSDDRSFNARLFEKAKARRILRDRRRTLLEGVLAGQANSDD